MSTSSNKVKTDTDLNTMLYNLKKTSKCMALRSSVHGVANVIESPNWFSRIVWVLCMLLSTSLCALLVVQNIQGYLKYDVVTKTSTMLEIPAPFPQVTICNINPFTKNNSIEFIKSLYARNGMSSILQGSYSQSIIASLNKYFLGANLLGLNYSDEYRKSLGLTLDDMMLSCVYNLEPCDSSWFQWFYDISYGNCYKFNARGDVTCHRPGFLNGLQLELFVSQSNPSSSYSLIYGAHVIINNFTSVPTFFDGLDVPTGAYTSIGVSRAYYEHLASPYTKCQGLKSDLAKLNTGLIQAVVNKFGAYQQTKCFDACFVDYLVDECGCQDVYAPSPADTDVPFCLNISQVACDLIAFSDFYSKNVEELCSNDCPLECDQIVYSYTTSSASYPSRVRYESLLKNPVILKHYSNNTSELGYESLASQILAMNIYYPELYYTYLTEDPKTQLVDMIASVGGILGLFLGVSFLSVVELFDLIANVLIITSKFTLSRKRTTKSFPDEPSSS